MIKEFSLGDITYYGSLAETAASIPSHDLDYYRFIDTISDQIADYMEKRGITKSELADRMGTSRAFITKILSGDANLTLKTLSRVLHHLDAKPEMRIAAKEDAVKWFIVAGAKADRMKTNQCRPFKNWSIKTGKQIHGKWISLDKGKAA